MGEEKQNKTKPENSHNLRKLAAVANISLSENLNMTLDLLTDILFWRGRYPAPLTEDFWNKYHDEVLENSLLRSPTGGVRANPNVFPSQKVCSEIWDECLRQYEHSPT
jgi:hypothetical protein